MLPDNNDMTYTTTKPKSEFYLGDRVRHIRKGYTGYICDIDYSPIHAGLHHPSYYAYLINIDDVPQKEWVAAIDLVRE